VFHRFSSLFYLRRARAPPPRLNPDEYDAARRS
jgi:hypothetical protein